MHKIILQNNFELMMDYNCHQYLAPAIMVWKTILVVNFSMTKYAYHSRSFQTPVSAQLFLLSRNLSTWWMYILVVIDHFKYPSQWLLLLGALGPTKLVAGGAASILPTGPGARSRPTLVRGGAATATESSPEQAQRNGTQILSRVFKAETWSSLVVLILL